MTALIIGPQTEETLDALRTLAHAHPVDMADVMEALKHRAGKAAHKMQMTRQTVHIPIGYMVTFSIETGHPGGTARHMSISTATAGRVPSQHAVWMVAERLGFIGGLKSCVGWMEDLEGHGQAVNLVQIVDLVQISTDAELLAEVIRRMTAAAKGGE
jgi:hypothetical protein